MKNVTITLDERVAEWSRVWAARHQTSVSRMLGELLAEKMAQEEQYTEAMQAWLAAVPAQGLDETGGPYPARESLHER
ncbi:MAG: CopG family transcriptional regulator [Pseudomonadota bacterium]